ncbi:hypothetical protein HF324_31925 [Chitinophaga oryzae]|uniref:PA14 domain-containing protein n=1 Tax=Chitinophaga oryzae TaxID=2725414 RepID=A0ABX6LPV9_9BACT|nr:hypothetical protein [Chitinophaga oryzae]QJB42201.1 hypothetical protein HF324_31925 [Chitinophaga oryzae]
MMIKNIKVKRALALFFLSLIVMETVLPLRALALTSGPVQPEHTQFSPYGANDMVDLFTGGFKYNIPLLDVDGYPINLNYVSGAGMDDEASWVGLGWNLNVGAINRQLRGLPDDMGGDQIMTEHYTKPKISYGGRGTVRMEVFGGNIIKLGGSVSVGVFSDNYLGMGAEFGANAGLGLQLMNSGMLSGGLNMNVGVNSNTNSGVSTETGLSLDANFLKGYRGNISVGYSASLSYNTREGIKELTLGTSFTVGKNDFGPKRIYGYNTPPFNPKVNIGYKSTNGSFSLDFGPNGWGIFSGFGLTGYKTKSEVLDAVKKTKAYGFLYADKGTNVQEAVMDFQREKENPVIPNLPNLPLPIATPDVFSYTNQAGSGQFRLNRGNAGVMFDNYATDVASNNSLSMEYGAGAYFHGGIAFYDQQITNTTSKWKRDNAFLPVSDYKLTGTDSTEEQAYFKVMGEQTAEDAGFTAKIKGSEVVSVPLRNRTALGQLKDKQGNATPVSGELKKTGRQMRNTVVSYMTAGELSRTKNRPSLQSFPLLTPSSGIPSCGPTNPVNMSRVIGYRKPHHIGEITVTEPDGKRAVYGVPVYNIRQDEYTFAVNPQNKPDTGISLIPVEMDGENGFKHNYGRDYFYQRDSQPAYAASYLLTQLLSPDYVDLNNDGITPDDPGTAIKFNYSRLPDTYKWRTPVEAGKAQYSRGQQADGADDKGNVVYGEKEIWYLHSIETKTKIVYFFTENRDDARGVANLYGTRNDANAQQRRLSEIRLYSKSDPLTPIKTVVLRYNYNLCPQAPNNVNGGGKLTLDSLYFTYNNSTRGKHHPYVFEYHNVSGYKNMSSDRWGNFKAKHDNASFGFENMFNDEFPYAVQNPVIANRNANGWNLKKVKLPTGGEIEVDYEAGDYAYVQDRPAMVMNGIKNLITDSTGTTTSDLALAHGFRVDAPGPLRGDNDAAILRNFVADYMGGRNDLYARLYVNVTDHPATGGKEDFDFVSCYAEVTKIRDNHDGTYNILFKDRTEGRVTVNPFTMAAWQKMKLEYPMYAYPGYKNRISQDVGIEEALSALVSAIGNLAELRQNFYERAMRKRFASKVDLSKSFVRMAKGNGIKLGGAARVKRVRIRDNWSLLTGTAAPSATYGQQYEYRITENGKTISSGVAAYEPYTGADENPMRMPVPYSQESKGALTNYFYLEEPFGESLFPSPQVGYRNVVVRQLDANGDADPKALTGWTQHEFYTAKDFPVIVEADAKPDARRHGPSGWASFTGGSQVYELAMSQGYVVWLNDMHGKPKAERIFNQSGAEISSNVIYYKTSPLDGGKLRLNSTVATINENGVINQEEMLGREIEMMTDMREQESIDQGTSIHLGLDIIPFIWFPLPIPHWPRKENDNYKLFRSASTLKTIQQTAIVDRVVKTVNGSSVTSANLVFDRNTGEPVVTSTTNEFGDPVYSVNMPAYWVYNKMGGAYRNIQTLLFMGTDANGVITSNKAYFTAGDELFAQVSGQRLWVIHSPVQNGSDKQFRLINDAGQVVKNYSGKVRILRSGYRNQTAATTATLLCLKNPVAGNRLGVLTSTSNAANVYQVLDAKTVLFEEEWNAPVCCPGGYVPSPDGTACIKLLDENPNDTLKLECMASSTSNGSEGATFKLVNGQWTAGKKNQFWGGDCGGLGLMKTATAQPIIAPLAASGDCQATVCGRLNATSVWLKGAEYALHDTWLGIETCVTVPESKTYAIGYGVDNLMRLYVDGVLTIDRGSNPVAEDYRYWHVVPVTLSAGSHALKVVFNNTNNGSSDYGDAHLGVELYNATPDELYGMERYLAETKILFNTKQLTQGKPYNSFISNPDGSIREMRYSCNGAYLTLDCSKQYPFSCDVVTAINPYLFGILGNWRPSEEKAYLVNREDQQIFANQGGGLNLRTSGYYRDFMPYWFYGAGSPWSAWTQLTSRWTSSRYVTAYDKYGQELENKDALLRYSSVLYGYDGAVPLAVASNARKREIFYDGFEDHQFYYLCYASPGCNKDSFSLRNTGATIVSNESHTGLFSMQLDKPLILTAKVHQVEKKPGYGNYTALDGLGQYIRKPGPGLYEDGFQPGPGGKYILSVWVKDKAAPASNPNITVTVAGINYQTNVPLAKKAVVEGWKLMEGTINVESTATQLQLNISGATNLLIDDIRIFPDNGNIKTFAYDNKALKLAAEMDENNYATFYEYDEEGTLVRVKKETERGIMTLKETRSAFRKAN